MAKPKKRSKGQSFAGIPRVVLDNPDYIGLGGNSIRLLVELARQFKGNNNGDLTAAWSLMQSRGFNSKDTLAKAIKELLSANLIVRTRTGLFQNPSSRCALYALTWQPINECVGKDLEVEPTIRPPRAFSLERNLKKCPVQKQY